MGRILVTVGAIAALGFLAYRTLYGTHPETAAGMSSNAERQVSGPKQTLNNVRAKAKDIEAKDQQYIDDMAEKTKE